jgi:hypothetical protein
MTTALGIITSAMRKAGILTKGESASADEAADGLEMLNDLLASISNDSMVVYARTLNNFTLSGGTSSYTIGTGATFNTARPIKIISAYVRSGTVDYPLTIVSDEQFATIPMKAINGIPQFLNFTNDFPNATIKLYPVPDSSYQIYLLTEKQLSTFALSDTVSLPPGWRRMLVYNLAIELAPEYGQSLPAEVVEIAKESKSEIRSAVMAAKSMQWDSGLETTGNIYSGYNS